VLEKENDPKETRKHLGTKSIIKIRGKKISEAIFKVLAVVLL
jgi:hypothetical protein